MESKGRGIKREESEGESDFIKIPMVLLFFAKKRLTKGSATNDQCCVCACACAKLGIPAAAAATAVRHTVYTLYSHAGSDLDLHIDQGLASRVVVEAPANSNKKRCLKRKIS